MTDTPELIAAEEALEHFAIAAGQAAEADHIDRALKSRQQPRPRPSTRSSRPWPRRRRC